MASSRILQAVNFTLKHVIGTARNLTSGMQTAISSPSSVTSSAVSSTGKLLSNFTKHLTFTQMRGFHFTATHCKMLKPFSEMQVLYGKHFYVPKPRVPKRSILDGCPQKKGVVLKTLIKKPKKPNSANRKCVYVRLSNGKEAVAYVPGVGHNLQEHNVVLVRMGRTKDVPGLKLKVIRGKYDCAHVIKKKPI